MTIDEYITRLREKNIIVQVRDNQLEVKASKEDLTPEVIAGLRDKKEEILNFFHELKSRKVANVVVPATPKPYYVLSPAQQRMYFLYQYDRSSVAYNMPRILRLGTSVKVDQLKAAIKALVLRHEVLRTSFEENEEGLVQRVHSGEGFEIESYRSTEEEVGSILNGFIRPFDLSDSPFRAGIITLDSGGYVLLMDMHHIISDGVSDGILIDNFIKLYQGTELPAVRLHYKDYAEWQQEESQQALLSRQKAYWLDVYAEPVSPLDLPLDHPRPEEMSYDGAFRSYTLSEELSSGLRSLSQDSDTTMFMMFLSVFNVFLGKVCSQEDIVVGTPVAGRQHADLEDVVGLFVNTLPLRYSVDGAISFRSFLERIKADTLQSFDNQSYPYEALIDALRLSRSVNRNPLFDVMFSYQNQAAPKVDLESLDVADYEGDSSQTISKFDLSFSVSGEGDSFHLGFEYKVSLFEVSTIDRFMGYIERIISAVLSNPDVVLNDIDILSSAEREELLEGFKGEEVAYPSGKTVLDLFKEQVSLTPDNIALICNDRQLTYKELDERSNQLANYLILQKGIDTENIVGIYLRRSEQIIIAMLGVLKSGGAYVPIDDEYTNERVGKIISESGMRYIITDMQDAIPEGVDVIDLQEDLATIDPHFAKTPDISIASSSLAYVIYTSGSTGVPNGVLISHHALLDYSLTFKKYFSITAADRVIQQSSIAFDTIVEEVFPALLSGASIMVMPNRGRDIEYLKNSIKKHGANVLSTTPLVLSELNNYAGELGNLRLIISGGDVLLPAHIGNLINRFPIYNTYGPSEATVCITYNRINEISDTSLIGKPVYNHRVYIVDRSGNLCARGVVGELCVSGPGLAQGYLNNTELTETKFIKNPYSSKEERMYRTGDLARWRADGTLEFMGRVDDQVKVRGYRIEPGEIEHQLLLHRQIESAVVVVVARGESEKYLVAYYVSAKELPVSELRGHLQAQLPDYMVPPYYVHLSSLPLNSSGKVNKRLLPSPDTSVSAAYEGPANAIEEQLVKVWAEVLKLPAEDISVTRSFFELGGHSLRATVMVNKLEKVLNVSVPLQAVFRYQDIRSLGNYISGLGHSGYHPIPVAADKPYYVLSPAQQRMYFLYQYDRSSVAYNMPRILRLGTSVKVDQLKAAIKGLVIRHEILRTSFFESEEGIFQRIHGGLDFEIDEYAGIEEDVTSVVDGFIRPFDLESSPFRAGIISLESGGYILLMDMHHIVNDGVSDGILLEDLVKLYQGDDLPEVRLHYKDYAEWQREESQQALLSRQKEYWLDVYSEPVTPLDLPLDHPRPEEMSYDGAFRNYTLSEELSSGLRALSQESDTTLFMTFLSVFNVFLGKVCNQEDIVVGTPVAGRQHADLEDVVGLFVNTLPLRNRVGGAMSFRSFLDQVKNGTLQGFEHQSYPYEALIDSLRINRSVNRNPLFDVLFTYQNPEGQTVDLGGLDVSAYQGNSARTISKFDLNLSVVDQGNQFRIDLIFKASLFKGSTIDRFMGYIERIISSMVSNPDMLLSEVDILSQAEREELLDAHNGEEVAYPSGKTILDLFGEQVSLTPDNIALVYKDRQLSYSELDERSNQLANYLIKEKGVVRGNVISLMVDRSPELIIGILGILKSGCTYLPLDGSQPEGRILNQLEESGSVLVLTGTAEALPYLDAIPSLDIYDKSILQYPVNAPGVTLSVSNTVYIIYTSGSTGRPKGVMIGHEGVINLIDYQKKYFGIGDDERILQFSTIVFDASVEQIWLALLSGSALVLIGKEDISDNERFRTYLQKHGVTHLHATPSFLESIDIGEIPTLRRVVSGGEACKQELYNRYKDRYSFYNKYGPTEITVTCIEYHATKNSPTSHVLPIGRPIQNTQVYILGKNFELLPKGTTGELYIGGKGLSQGYLNNPVLTEEKFVKTPYSSKGERMYRTGDLARWRTDGTLEFMGRVDEQVKVRGYRIEPGEIEHQLLLDPRIERAVVVARGEFEKYLVAYYVSAEELPVSELRGHLQAQLPDYMVPPYYMHLSALPLTTSGKVNKRELPAPDITFGVAYEGPANAIEKQLVKVWSDVLKLPAEDISVTRSFFELGGHSLRATVMVNKLEKVLNVSVPLQAVFRYQDIRSLGSYISGLGQSGYRPIPVAAEKPHYVLSSAQQRMYFLYQYDRSSVAYNMPRVLRLGSSVKVDQLKAAIKALVLRHEILRTSFEEQEEGVVQRIHSGLDFDVEEYSSGEEGISAIAERFVRPFNLSEGPFRAGIITLDSGGYVLLMDMHHIVNDGVSDGILIDDFIKLYQGTELPAVSLHYKDYAEWQQEESQQALLSRQKAYWLDVYVEPLSPLDLPLDHPRPEEMSHEGAFRSYTLSEELSSGLRSLSQDSDTTMFMTFLSVFNVFLGKVCNQEDIVVGTPVAGRRHADLEDVVGLFVNTLPLRNRVGGAMSFRSFLDQVKNGTLQGFEHQSYPYEALIDSLRISRSVNRTPLFDVMFTYQNLERHTEDYKGLDVMGDESSLRTISKFDLTLSVSGDGDSFHLGFEYKASLFESSTIDRFMGYIERIITSVLANPDVVLNDIDILSDVEREELLEAYNGEEVAYPSGKTITDLFGEQVSLTPDNIALVYKDRQLSYSELDERSNQLANYLIKERDVVRGNVIGLMVDRSPELIIGILGILKSGCTYLPLDGSQPEGRILSQLEESGSVLVLTGTTEALPFLDAIPSLNIYDKSILQYPVNAPAVTLSVSDTVYIIYTSGSTGRPKGVMIGHEGVINLIDYQKKYFGIGDDERILQFSTIVFDASVEQIWLALLSGSALVLIGKEDISDNERFRTYLQKHGVTHLHATPSFLESIDIGEIPTLRRVVSGGEACKQELYKRYKDRYSFYNEYGPTETTVTSIEYHVTESSPTSHVLPIGSPIQNTQVYILGKNFEVLPKGTTGELYIGGKGLSQGYLNNPVLTEEKFVKTPYSSKGERMYRTGDLARWRADGTLEFMGRVDDQVKVRGYRIEPGEIEHQLLLDPRIERAVVVARGESEKYLVAYYVSAEELPVSELRGHLQAQLPDYMVPPYYVHLSALPLTTSGKVNQRELPAPDITFGVAYEGPANAIEEQLVKVWSEVLKLPAEDISVTRSFFELGGHSLRATVMVNKLAKVLNVTVPLQAVFRYQDIRSLGSYISGLGQLGYRPIPVAAEKPHYVLSSAQQRMYFLYQYNRSSVAYNMPRVLRLGSSVKVDQLRAAIKSLVLRHEILRTSFEEQEEGVVQRIHSGLDFDVEEYSSGEEGISAIAERFVRPFNLSEGPFRAGIITLDSGGYVLLMDMHHIVNDGVSDGILIDDFIKLYLGKELSAVRLHYKDYAEWQQEESQRALLSRQKAYWLDVYSEPVSPLDLPLDYARPEEMSHEGAFRNYTLSEELSSGLRALSQDSDTTLFMTFLSVFNVFLEKVCNQEDIVVATPVAGRQHADLENVVGLFVNTLPLRYSVDGTLSFRSFLEHIKAGTLQSFDNQSYPYEELVDALRVSRSANRNPLFDVMFTYQNLERHSEGYEGLDVMGDESSFRTISKFDLALSVSGDGDSFHLGFKYKASLFESSTIDRFMGYIERIITSVLANPDVVLNDIDILSDVEREELLEAYNGEEVAYPSGKTITDLFGEQVSLTPDNIALVYKDRQLSYSELDERSNQLANYLIKERGVVRGNVIGLMVDRSPELIIGILGILKSGCTYLPLDGSHPEGRILNQLEESGSVLVLTGTAEALPFLDAIPSLDIYDKSILQYPVNAPAVTLSVSDTVYIIYTSGSTGRPKGVMIGHEGVINLIDYQKKYFGIGDDERILQFSTIVFDASVEQIWLALLSGSALVLIGKEDISDNERFKRCLVDRGVTHLHATPSFLESIDIGEVPTLRRVVSGGEACKQELYKRYKDRYLFYNKYGPTEITVTCIEYHVTESSPTSHVLPIGSPIQNTQVYILGKNFELLPKGATGELYIGGKGLSQGYLNNPVLTEEKFVKNPYSSKGGRMYRTGDLARWRTDGILEFMGRIDEQVKVRGYRIEHGEIEHQLLSHPEIDSVVVVARGESEKYLVAYYVSAEELPVSELRGHLQAQLPDYMVPPYYVHLSALPLTTSGKVNQRELPAPDITCGVAYEGPATAIEEQLVKVWSEVLKLPAEDISVTRSFFELGGHSLRATVMVNKLEKALNVTVPLQAVFRYQDIRSLGNYISGLGQSGYCPIPVAAEKPHYVLSSAQQRMYFLYQYNRSSVAYNMPRVLRLGASVKLDQLKAAIKGLVLRHEVLRTSFEENEDGLVQRVHTGERFEIESYRSTEEEVDSIVNGFIRPFDLSDSPFRVGIVTLDSGGYVLLMDMHHIISDGVSDGILIDNFIKLYQGTELPAVSLHYKDYAEWQQEESQQALLSRQKAYWLDVYSEPVSPLDLPLDYPRPEEMSHDGAFRSYTLSEELSSGLRSLSQDSDTTMFMMFLSVFNVFLGKVCNQEDIVVGTPVAGRQHADLEDVVGLFVNTLPLRYSVDGTLSFRSFLEHIKAGTLQSFDNQSYPYEALIDALRLSRSVNRNPLFDVMFTYQNLEGHTADISGLDVSDYESNSARTISKFDLNLSVIDEGNQFRINLIFKPSLYKESTIDRFMEYIERITSSVVSKPDMLLRDIDILSSAEREELLGAYKGEEVAYPSGKTVLDLFKEQVSLTPENIALVYNGVGLTYQDLNSKSDKLACHMLQRGVTRGDIICIMTEPSFDLMIGLLGILKCGAAFLPIAPDYPDERINYILKDSGHKLLLTQSKFISQLPSTVNYINLEELSSYDLSGEVSSTTFPVDRDLAYVIYTSGSTGNPKGVLIEHHALTNLCNWHNTHFDIGSSDRATKYAGIGFDASIWEIFPYLIVGASIHIIDNSIRYDIHQLNDYYNANNITISFLPTQVCEQFSTLTNHSLRILLTGGDKLRVVHKNDYVLYNNYGPTENAVVTTSFEIDADSLVSGNIPIGKPVYNHRIYIVDRFGNLCARGVVGELCVSGPGLARGYLNNPVLTEEKFVKNPYSSKDERMYRTGDLARWRADGTLEFMGRVDDQVKVRGYRIEPGEIEHQLLLHHQVESAVVVARGESEKYLVAYYVSAEELPVSELRGHLQSQLPDYMVPPYYVHLSALPLTSSGKVNKRELPSPDITMGSTYEGPATAIEEQLVKVWSEVLKLPAEDISVTHSFFELGGHSLRATVMVNKLGKALNVSVPLQAVFRYQDIRSLGSYISGLGQSGYQPIPVAADKPHYVLSPAQQRMYFLYQYDRSSVAYNMPRTLRLGASVEVDQLRAAIKSLVLRHEILRTSFFESEEGIFQRIHGGSAFEIGEYAGTEEDVPSIVDGFIRPFDLGSGPFRAGIISLESGGYILLMDMHHIVNDGVSDGILVDDLIKLYLGKELSPVRLQYKDYAEWQHEESQQALLSRQKAYWLDVYSEPISPLDLPLDHPRPEEMSYDGAFRSYTLSEELSSGLRALSQGSDATLYMTFLSVFNVFLGKVCNQEDIVVGTPVAGRQHADLEHVVGLFVNTLPLRNHVGGAMSFRSFLEEVKNGTLQGFEHQGYPYEALIDSLRISRSVNRNPLFDVMFTYQNLEGHTADISGLDVSAYEGNSTRTISKFDLSLSVSGVGDCFHLGFEYKASLFKESTIDRFMEYIERIIFSVVSEPDMLLREIDILSRAEREELLAGYNGEEVDYPSDKTIIDLFREQVSLTPDNIALVYNDRQLSYSELDERSNQLANYLIHEKGISRGNIVGLMVDRSPELIIGILGIVKSGCTYLPLDSSQPEGRILSQLEESRAVIVLTGTEGASPYLDAIPSLSIYDGSIVECPVSVPAVKLSVSDTVYIIYTSGSTGRPKGVMIGHDGVVNLIDHQKKYFGIGDDERILQFSTIVFDASVEQIWLALLSGSALVLIGKEDISDNERFRTYLVGHGVTHLHATPSFLESIDIGDVPTLRRVVAGGEACKSDLYHRYKDRYSFYNEYGPTETTVTSIEYHVTESAPTSHILPIGMPIQNTQVYILGKNLEVLPAGTAGELYLGGKGLSQGYLNNPVLTEEKFVKNPYSLKGERMYRTGDLARWRSDGTLEFMGRVDEQVKVRGYRIEPGEIEHQLLLHHQVESAVVVARGESEKYLVAYYVSAEELPVSELLGHLQSQLPDYMVPPYYVHLSALPLTTSGKVNKRELPSPDITMGSAYEGPANTIEEQMVKVWSEVLKLPVEDISVTRSFFELGGNSINAMKLISKIKYVFKEDVTLKDIFNDQTVRRLSENIVNTNLEESLVIALNEIKQKHYNAFFIPPIVGSSTIFKPLALLLNSHYNVFGFQYKGFDHDEPFSRSIEEMAYTYVNLIEKMEADRSILLMGYSMGVIVAFEMAKMLEAHGYNVTLVLLDRYPYQEVEVLSEQSIEIIVKNELQDWLQHIENHQLDRLKKLINNNIKIQGMYKVNGKVKGKIIAVEANARSDQGRMRGWKDLTVGEFEHHFINGDHYSLLEGRNLDEISMLVLSGLPQYACTMQDEQ